MGKRKWSKEWMKAWSERNRSNRWRQGRSVAMVGSANVLPYLENQISSPRKVTV